MLIVRRTQSIHRLHGTLEEGRSKQRNLQSEGGNYDSHITTGHEQRKNAAQ